MKTTSVGGERGYDGAKRFNGRKRHLLVDTQGLVLKAKVHKADLQDRAAVALVLEGIGDLLPRLAHLWTDQGYNGTGKAWIEDHLGWTVEIVRHPRSRAASGRRSTRSSTGTPSFPKASVASSRGGG